MHFIKQMEGMRTEAGTFTIMDELRASTRLFLNAPFEDSIRTVLKIWEVKIHHTQEPKTRNALALFFHARLSVATVLHRLLLLRRLHILSGVSSLISILIYSIKQVSFRL
ncbi:hypothetical protein L1887_00165 [Cichorium endivia]|nr:hypothetical protein L1887_00165 [Cichorium endivia]